MTTIANNLQKVLDQMAQACQAAGRAPASVALLAVSKTFGPEAVHSAARAGQRAFGENYIQEAVEKMAALRALAPELAAALEWHCIGPIQSNKTRLVAEHFDWAQTVDRLKIAQRLSDQRPAHLPPLMVCIQVNVDGGATKSGVPPEEAPALVDSANLMSDVNASDAEQAGARQHLFDYFRDLGALKRRQPADDLATLLVEADFPEGEEPQQLLDAYFMLLTIAGNETTRFLVTGGLAQLVRQGDYPLLRDHGELLPTATEEMCRFVSPVTHMRRTASTDTAIAGQAIAKGDKVVLWFASGNRDEKMFREAGRLVLDRKPNPHMGFGIGPHFCLGAHLARLETRLLFEALGRHIETIELVGDPERLPSNWFTGWSAMKVRWQ